MDDDEEDAAVKRRRLQSEICSRVMLRLLTEYSRGYRQQSHVGAVTEEMTIAWAVFANPGGLRVADVKEITSIPRTNIDNAIPDLIERGLVLKNGHLLTPNLQWCRDHLHDEYFKNVVQTIIEGGKQLQATLE